MTSTTEINSIIEKARQQRADYIASKLQLVPAAFVVAGLVSVMYASLFDTPSEDHSRQAPQVEVAAQHG